MDIGTRPISSQTLITVFVCTESVQENWTADMHIFWGGDCINNRLMNKILQDSLSERSLLSTAIKMNCLNCLSFQELKNAILEDILRLGKEGGLKSFEQVRQPS